MQYTRTVYRDGRLAYETHEAAFKCPVCGWPGTAYGCYYGQCREPRRTASPNTEGE